MRKLIGSGLLFAIGGFLVWAQSVPEGAKGAFSDIDDSLARLSKITGFKQVRKVQFDTIDKPRLKVFLEEQIKQDVKPDEIRAEELALKKLGLVPQNFDLARNTVDLMTEQAAAFYDYRKKKLFLMDAASPSGDQDTVLAHELAHALADQHFNLNKYLHHGKTDDSSLARMAVMEGQATWLMYEVQAQKIGQSLTTSPSIVEAMSQSSDSGNSQFPVLSKAPLYMRESLLFPYMQGLKFQQAVVLKLGKTAFSEVFRNPPANSQEILHPEMYMKRVTVKAPAMPSIENRSAYRVLTGGSIGEFDHAILIQQYTGKKEAEVLAPHWRGGGFELLEEKKKRHTVLLYASVWDDPSSAKEMFEAYRRILTGKWKTVLAKKEAAGLLIGEGDDGYFRLQLEGTRLTSIEGMKTLSEVTDLR